MRPCSFVKSKSVIKVLQWNLGSVFVLIYFKMDWQSIAIVIVIVHFSTFQCPSWFNSHMTLHIEMRICLILCVIDRDGEQNKHTVFVGGVVIKCFQNTKRRKIPDTFHSYIPANSMFEISYIFLSATTAICQSISLFLDCALPLECVSWLVLDTFFQAFLFSFSFEIFSIYSLPHVCLLPRMCVDEIVLFASFIYENISIPCISH